MPIVQTVCLSENSNKSRDKSLDDLNGKCNNRKMRATVSNFALQL